MYEHKTPWKLERHKRSKKLPPRSKKNNLLRFLDRYPRTTLFLLLCPVLIKELKVCAPHGTITGIRWVGGGGEKHAVTFVQFSQKPGRMRSTVGNGKWDAVVGRYEAMAEEKNEKKDGEFTGVGCLNSINLAMHVSDLAFAALDRIGMHKPACGRLTVRSHLVISSSFTSSPPPVPCPIPTHLLYISPTSLMFNPPPTPNILFLTHFHFPPSHLFLIVPPFQLCTTSFPG